MAKYPSEKIVYKINWEESERGWGIRPDGFSLHLSKEDSKKYVKDYWDRQPDGVPDEYSRPSGEARPVVIRDKKMIKEIIDNGHIRVWHHEESKYPIEE